MAGIQGFSSSLALENMILEDLEQDRPVFIVGAAGDVAARLAKLGVLDRVPDGHVVATRQEALELATALLERRAEQASGATQSAPASE